MVRKRICTSTSATGVLFSSPFFALYILVLLLQQLLTHQRGLIVIFGSSSFPYDEMCDEGFFGWRIAGTFWYVVRG